MTSRDFDVLVTHRCGDAACPNRAEVVLTPPRTGPYLLLVCRVCAPRYQAMLAQPGLLAPGVPRRQGASRQTDSHAASGAPHHETAPEHERRPTMRHETRRHGAVGLLVGAALWGLSGCRAVGTALGNRDAELRTGQWWAGPLPDTTPPQAHERVAWVAYKNVTQDAGFDVREGIRQGLLAQGYRLTGDPEQAQVQVVYTLRFFGENPQADEGRSVAATLGGVTGGASGALLAHGAGGSTPAVLGGGLGGALVGGLAGTALAHYAQVIEYTLILDVRLAQRQKALVTRTTVSRQRDAQRTATGGRTGGGVVGGTRGTTHDTEQQFQEADHLLWHENRLVLWARQIRLQPEEARPVLEQALVRALPHIVP